MSLSLRRHVLGLGLAAVLPLSPQAARAGEARAGIVLMHGKGGGPERTVAGLARQLQTQGCLVANEEMPWSGRRQYDASVADALAQVQAALQRLRAQGATRLFVAGHSQGGVFALLAGGRLPVDGVIAIAPGGNVAGAAFQAQVAPALTLAREQLAQGRGDAPGDFADYEGSTGLRSLRTTAARYVDWFDPAGAMNQLAAERQLPATLPVLYIAPTRDYPALQHARPEMVAALPAHPLTRVLTPEATHAGAPDASAEPILAWLREVIAAAL